MAGPPRDRLRVLLDAVVPPDTNNSIGETGLAEVAAAAHSSPFHFARQITAATGESPMALRRRVLLERSAWRLQRGARVTEVAFEAGYESVEGFARAFTKAYGHAPSLLRGELDRVGPADRGHWLPAPNGLHFHSPTVIYLDAGETTAGVVAGTGAGELTTFQVHHDIADVEALLRAAEQVSEPDYRRVRLPGHQVLAWSGPEESLAQLMGHLVRDKLPWLASIEGGDAPDLDGPDDPESLLTLHHQVSQRWLGWVRDVDRRSAWHDRIIDALCDPPESFLLSQILVHVLTFSAHRRQLARWFLRDAGVAMDTPDLDPDPIMWHRRRSGGLA